MLSALPLLALAGAASATLPRLGGYNLAGMDFGANTWGWTDGGSPAQPPPITQVAHFAAAGANLVRIPFSWQRLQPTPGGTIDAAFFATIDGYVKAALATGAYVELDLHSYGRYESKVVGLDGPSNAQFADLWSQLATKYKSESRIIFGIMNEPHDMNDLNSWVGSVQAAVTGIRAAGANSQHILLPGNEWTHIAEMIRTSGPALLNVKDPAGGTDKLLFDVHAYLDSDGSGTHTECTTDNVDLLTQLDTWLASIGRQAILSETGAGNNANCVAAFSRQLDFVSKHPKTIAGFAVWSAGSFSPSYELSIVPTGDVDNDLAKKAVFPYFPGVSSSPAPPTASGAARRRHRSAESIARWENFNAAGKRRLPAGGH